MRYRTSPPELAAGIWSLARAFGAATFAGLVSSAAALFLTPSQAVHAGPLADAEQSVVNYTRRNVRPRMNCRALRSLTTAEFSVVEAMVVGEGDNAACRVELIIPAEIRAEISLPLRWNGRFLMFGNGGLAGTPPEDSARRAFAGLAVQHGFVSAYTDTGHDRRVETGGTFAYRRLDKLIDYGFRAVHLTNQTARQLMTAFYRKPLNKAYFFGCSTGGRQALMSAQRFPEDFDGILAGAPANDYSGLKFSQAWRMAALKDKPLEQAEVLDLAKRIYARCDAQDGLADGLLDDPQACDFSVSKHLPRCGDDEVDAVDCYTLDEVQALESYYAPVTVGENRVYPAFLPGSEVAGPDGQSGWVPWVLNNEGPALLDLLGSDFFRYMAYVVDKPDFDWVEYDFQHEPDNLRQFRAIVDAIDPDLSRFKARGGKLISYFGWADPDIHPVTAISYRSEVSAITGGIDDFYSLYMAPGMFHCRGGPGPNDFDALTPLIDWVERGRVPGSIVATQKGLPDGSGRFTRPLCPYPQRAVYSGAGDINEAESFSCKVVAKRLSETVKGKQIEK